MSLTRKKDANSFVTLSDPCCLYGVLAIKIDMKCVEKKNEEAKTWCTTNKIIMSGEKGTKVRHPPDRPVLVSCGLPLALAFISSPVLLVLNAVTLSDQLVYALTT